MCSEETTAGDDRRVDDSALLSCPSCGQPITGLTSTGPHTGVVRPCGCSVAPGLIHRERDSGIHHESDTSVHHERDDGTGE
ncbi:hypothetical protein [Natrinema longum]|uniref:Small CPxCG-related zinc finger protein n=1 Tax=Natrinema longum TaxID=370324 RepID=A0A8A2U735_9EURY|nr:hypothetical protein [Natrinema longum]MBZ6494956.1 hypothetical protein [Natrinema longum]QSW83748.1 hypothetical protein J0X27_09655 [Natrinema longum]